MRRRAPSARQCGRTVRATDGNSAKDPWPRAPAPRSFGGLASGVAERDAGKQREVTQRIAQLGAGGLRLGNAAIFDGVAAAWREEAAGRAIELAGNDARYRGEAAAFGTLGEGRKQCCGVGMVRVGEQADDILLLDLLAGIMNRDTLRGLGDDTHVVGDEHEAHAGVALQLE